MHDSLLNTSVFLVVSINFFIKFGFTCSGWGFDRSCRTAEEVAEVVGPTGWAVVGLADLVAGPRDFLGATDRAAGLEAVQAINIVSRSLDIHRKDFEADLPDNHKVADLDQAVLGLD